MPLLCGYGRGDPPKLKELRKCQPNNRPSSATATASAISPPLFGEQQEKRFRLWHGLGFSDRAIDLHLLETPRAAS
jgi:hypothetical protein